MQRRETGGNLRTTEGKVGHDGVIRMVDLTLHKGFQQEKIERHQEQGGGQGGGQGLGD